MRLTGIGYRWGLQHWLATQPEAVGCLELTAEHYFEPAEEMRLRWIGETHPTMVHGLGLSLGTPGPLDGQTLEQFVRVAAIAKPRFVSEHIAFTRTPEVDLGHLNPIPYTRESLRTVAAHARQVREACGLPIVLENITSHLRLLGEMSEPAFLNALCEECGCGLLLDVTNLFINSRNHGYDPRAWLDELELSHVRQLHVVGYTRTRHTYEDFHAAAIQPDLFALIREVLEAAPAVEAVILERDNEFPDPAALVGELEALALVAEPAPIKRSSPIEEPAYV